jgi:hypothetical protein
VDSTQGEFIFSLSYKIKVCSGIVKIIDAWIKLHTKKPRIINSLHRFYRSDDFQEDEIESISRGARRLEEILTNSG